MKLTEIILQGTAPVQTRALWAKPSDDGIVELKVFNNGAWQDTFTTPDLSPYMKTSDFNKEIVKYLLKTDASGLYQTKTDDTLSTTSKAVVGAINELKSSVDSKATPQNITDAINALDVETVDAVSGEVIKSVGQVDGKVVVEKKTLTSEDIPELSQSKITDLETTLAGKQDAGDYATNSALTDGLATKQDTLTPGTGIEITPENQINITLDTTVFYVVETLPVSPDPGNENKICLVPTDNVSTHIEFDPEVNAVRNEYTEYIWVNNRWEELGKYYSEVDLTPYLKSADAESTYLKITNAESEYATKTELAGKQNSTDDTLKTTHKTIVGAINEILPKATGVGKVDPNSDGTGEVFNSYEGDYANVASGQYSHAEGYRNTATGWASHAECDNTNAS